MPNAAAAVIFPGICHLHPPSGGPQRDELVPNFSGLLHLPLAKTYIICGEILQPQEAPTA